MDNNTNKKARRGTKEAVLGSPVEAAKTRIEMCERYGMPVDPRDVEIVAAG